MNFLVCVLCYHLGPTAGNSDDFLESCVVHVVANACISMLSLVALSASIFLLIRQKMSMRQSCI